VDVIIPTAYDKQAEEASAEDLAAMIPSEHRAFMDRLLADAKVPPLPDGERERITREIVEGRGSMTPDGARRLLAVALEHPQVKMVVSALGSPPPDVIALLRERQIVIGAMCGKAEHAARHMQAGVDVIVAQGTEAGGHTGEIATMVLVYIVAAVFNLYIPRTEAPLRPLSANPAELVRDFAQPGDYVVCLGAGNITQWAYALPEQLAAGG
jgi:NAD(P)H-dependent flavin oxidoreductase YrpB (nitropropane dioxygenase family)